MSELQQETTSSYEDCEECFGHDYDFIEPLPSNCEETFEELWACIHCGHERVLTHYIGICD